MVDICLWYIVNIFIVRSCCIYISHLNPFYFASLPFFPIQRSPSHFHIAVFLFSVILKERTLSWKMWYGRTLSWIAGRNLYSHIFSTDINCKTNCWQAIYFWSYSPFLNLAFKFSKIIFLKLVIIYFTCVPCIIPW